uniref:Ribosomal protein L1 n=1 Tax=Scylla olivacea TaxID=85551 RepID=A0A0P4WD89_SCYOL
MKEVVKQSFTHCLNRFIDDFYNVLRLPHDFNTEQERTILVVARSEDVQEKAIQMGATHAAGHEIIKQAQTGEINLRDYDHFIAETDILPDFVAVRGLIRKRFPSVRNGTAGIDVLALLERFTKGIEYHTAKDKYHHDYATIRVPFGRLNMPSEQLEENLSALLKDVDKQKPNKKSNDLITRAIILCPPVKRYFKINHGLYLQSEKPIKVAAAV